jgi:peptidoglycan/xylan/chitin deacetylase (PgdA/CDA1 family)
MNQSSWSDDWGPWPAPNNPPWKSRVKFMGAWTWAAARRLLGPPTGIPILTYHGTPAETSHLWWHDFRGQMSLLAELGYEVVTLADVVDHVTRGTPRDRPAVAITFDDGWRDILDVALPELAARGWPATIFIPSSFLDRRPFVTRVELRDVVGMGFDIGNHTHTHPDVATISAAALREELRRCSDVLGEITGQVPRFFCYPYGRYDPESRDVVAQFGFAGACAGRYDFNRPGGDPFVLRRVLQEPGEGTRELRARLAGGYGFLDWRQTHMDRPRRRA